MTRKILARALLAAALVIGLTTFTAAPASAAQTAAAVAISFSLPIPLVIGLLVSTVLPLLVGLVTTRVTHAGVKAILLAALAAITGLLSELSAAIAAERTYDLGVGLLVALGAFLVAVGLHYGFYKPTGLSTRLQDVGANHPPAR